jgi:5'-nucleotidase
MDRLLLTNDDGVDSPALAPFARALGALGEVDVVVPDRERSWIGKAISRVEEVTTATVERDGLAVTTCTGYPADAVQLGVKTLPATPPDVVVSGINLGLNHGSAFLLSSGTVGAAVEAWICGLPGIAFSTGVGRTRYASWRREAASELARDAWERIATVCAAVLADLLATDLPAAADVISVNVPWDVTAATPRRVTTVARTGYGRLFDAVDVDRYRHSLMAVDALGPLDGTDVEAFGEGAVTITPLRMPAALDVPDDLRAWLERGGA